MHQTCPDEDEEDGRSSELAARSGLRFGRIGSLFTGLPRKPFAKGLGCFTDSAGDSLVVGVIAGE